MTSDNQLTLLEFPLTKSTTPKMLKRKIFSKYKTPVRYQELYFQKKILTNLDDLLEAAFNGSNVQEILVLNLLFLPTNHKAVVKFCEEHNNNICKNITVQFLTSNFTIDLIKDRINTIQDMKLYIQKHKTIPIYLQKILFQRKEVGNITVPELFAQQDSSGADTIVISLFVMAPKMIKLKVSSNFDFHAELEVEETTSVLKLKEILSEECRISIDQIHLQDDMGRILKNYEQLWQCEFYEDSEDLILYKTIQVEINEEHREITKENFRICLWETDTVESMRKELSRSYKGLGKTLVLDQNNTITAESFLKDIDSVVQFTVKDLKSNTSCIIS